MKWLKIVGVCFFIFPVGILKAAASSDSTSDSVWIMTDDTNRTYFSYSVCDTERNPLTGDSACLADADKKCDTGDVQTAGQHYINFNYQMIHGYAGFKIDWDAGTSRFNATGFDSIIIYHKGPAASQTVTVNFGASATCGAPTIFTRLGTFSGSTTWKREALSLPTGVAAIGLYELQVLLNDGTNATASGNFKLGTMCFIKHTIKLKSSAPSLSSPIDSALKNPAKVTFSWNPVSIATSYTIEISSSRDFISQVFQDTGIVNYSNVIYSQTVTAPTTPISGIFSDGQPYYWHVLSINADGRSPWSGEWSFTASASAPAEPSGSSSKKSGCGSGFALAFIPPIWLKASSIRRKRMQKKA